VLGDPEEKVVDALLEAISICKGDVVPPKLIILGQIRTKNKMVDGVCLLYNNPTIIKTYELYHGLRRTVAYDPGIKDRYFINSGYDSVKLSELSMLLLEVELTSGWS